MKGFLKNIGFIGLVLSIFAVSASAQIAEKKSLTLEGARTVIAAVKEYARKNNAPGGVIAVVDGGGNPVALERLDGTFSAGANISIGKAKTAVIFKRPTKVFEDIIKNGRTAMAWGDADGKTLYLTARNGLYKMRLNIAGVRPVIK